VGEHERIVDKLNGRQFLRVDHSRPIRWGVVCRTPASNNVMAITKWSISGSEKG
jgi:hypothetical protein